MSRKTDWEPPLESPIPFGRRSNGEVAPRPPDALLRFARDETLRRAEAAARRLGMDRRAFLRSALGTATALSVINTIAGCKRYAVPDDTCDADGVREVLSGSEFVFDIQTHHIDVDPDAPWREGNPGFRGFFEYLAAQQGCAQDDFACLGRAAYVQEVFVDSDTDVAVLSGVPSPQDVQPLDNPGIAATREHVNALAASRRLLTHGVLLPNVAAELDAMAAITGTWSIAGWKVYTQWGPSGTGWFFDDATVGQPFLQKVRELGPKIVCVHKGLTFAGQDPRYASPRDIGPAAAANPDLQFVVYHSGREGDVVEGPYDPAGSPDTVEQGANRLVKSLLNAGLGPNGNVWAELGSAWNALVTEPDQAAHLLGKLLLHVGEDRVCWGTDCIWYGSPQPFIEAFRAFTIPEEMQARWGYPALTAERKAKILGLNGAALYGVDPAEVRCTIAADALEARKQEPRHLRPGGPGAYGPRTRREFAALLRTLGGRPG